MHGRARPRPAVTGRPRVMRARASLWNLLRVLRPSEVEPGVSPAGVFPSHLDLTMIPYQRRTNSQDKSCGICSVRRRRRVRSDGRAMSCEEVRLLKKTRAGDKGDNQAG